MAGRGRRIATGVAFLLMVGGGLALAGLLFDFWVIPPEYLGMLLMFALAVITALAVILPPLLLIVLGDRLLRRRAPGLRWLVPVAVGAVVFACGTLVYRQVQRQARHGHDLGMIEAMRSAVEIYYRAHGSYPEHPGSYVSPSPPVFQCAARRYTYSPTTGQLRITSENDVAECP